ncbi:class II glutamine amidotransferase, partial [Streptomyces sp. UNOC14_S4]|nr:class II glutamine amidotransferase [Streptomyces sp. UNOC14_S4]
RLPPAALLRLAARCDAAFVWALAEHRLRGGEAPGAALAGTVADVAAAAPGSRLNLLLTDGTTIAATAWGDSLWYLTGPAGRTAVASEPYDDDPGWTEVPDGTLLTATRAGITLLPLAPSSLLPPDPHKEPAQ